MQKTVSPFRLLPVKTVATLLGIAASLSYGSTVEAAPTGRGE